MEVGGRVIGDTDEDIIEPCLRVHVLGSARLDQVVDNGSTVAAAILVAQTPCRGAERAAAKGPLGGVGAATDAAIARETKGGKLYLRIVKFSRGRAFDINWSPIHHWARTALKTSSQALRRDLPTSRRCR